jgi:hypothetical protein
MQKLGLYRTSFIPLSKPKTLVRYTHIAPRLNYKFLVANKDEIKQNSLKRGCNADVEKVAELYKVK